MFLTEKYKVHKSKMAAPRGRGFIGSIDGFEASKEDWHNYQRRLEIWMKANKIADEDKVNVFLAMIGASAFEIVTNFVSPEDPSEKQYDELIKILVDYYSSTRNQIALRMAFRKRHQEPQESVASYINELKKLSRHCGYGTELETNLRDTFVGGLCNRRIQAKLLSKGNTLTWKNAREEAMAMEMADKDSGNLQGTAATSSSTTSHASADSNEVSSHKQKGNWNCQQRNCLKCYRCHGEHYPQQVSSHPIKMFQLW